MTIKHNLRNDGLYTVVEKNGQYYVLDLCYTLDHGVECMGFPCDENGRITDFGDVYVSFPEAVSEENLIACVEEFLAQ